MVVTVLFFQMTGSAMSLKSDPICEDPGNPIGFVLASTFATFVAALPVVLSILLSKRKVYVAQEWTEEQRLHHIRQWKCISKAMWVYDVAFMLLSIIFTLSFLANLSKADYWKWYVSFVTIVVRWSFMMPFIYSATIMALVGASEIFQQKRSDSLAQHQSQPNDDTLNCGGNENGAAAVTSIGGEAEDFDCPMEGDRGCIKGGVILPPDRRLISLTHYECRSRRCSTASSKDLAFELQLQMPIDQSFGPQSLHVLPHLDGGGESASPELPVGDDFQNYNFGLPSADEDLKPDMGWPTDGNNGCNTSGSSGSSSTKNKNSTSDDDLNHDDNEFGFDDENFDDVTGDIFAQAFV